MISAEEIATLNAARTILARIGAVQYNAALMASGKYADAEARAEHAAARLARVATMAEQAEHAVFMALNYTNTYGRVVMTAAQLHNVTDVTA